MRSMHLAAEAADAELQALDVGDRLDLLAEPAAHLRAGVAAGEVDDVVLGVELAHQLEAVAFVHPRRHLARVQAERDRAAEREGRILAEEVVRRGVRHLDGARSARRRRRRTPASARRPRAPRSGTCRPSSRPPSWRTPRRRRRSCRANAESSTPCASGCWPAHCTIAGAAPAARTPARPVLRMKERRSMSTSPVLNEQSAWIESGGF